MAVPMVDELYERLIKPLPLQDQLRLVEKIIHELSATTTEETSSPRHDWMTLRGIAPNLLSGEDAQAWVSRTCRDADEQRAQQWRPA